ncbi:MAG: L,D-transpeptidase, partial [Actinomycetales bacterium]|nr:L,D-transpeptidase [Actinomycetales bacterium]
AVAPHRAATVRTVVAATDPPVPRAGGPAPAYVPTRPLPARSGTGRRIVYAERAAHLWVVGADGAVLRDYPVTGRAGRPKPGVYHVYSKSTVAVNPGEKLRFEYMVRFAVGVTGARIGFHTIPRYYDGVPIQSESQLGRAIGAGGCVRQSRADARWLYGWSRVGDTVVVLR